MEFSPISTIYFKRLFVCAHILRRCRFFDYGKSAKRNIAEENLTKGPVPACILKHADEICMCRKSPIPKCADIAPGQNVCRNFQYVCGGTRLHVFVCVMRMMDGGKSFISLI